MRNYTYLFRCFILRAMLREKVRTAIVLLGIVLGVAVMIAIRLANRSVTDSFRTAVDAISGTAALRIRGSAGRFDELRLRDLDWLREFGDASPVIETYARVPDDGQSASPTPHCGAGVPPGPPQRIRHTPCADVSGGTRSVPDTFLRTEPGDSLPSGPPGGTLLYVLGVDVLQDAPLRRYRLLRTSETDHDPTPQEFVRLLTEPEAVVLTARFAARTGRRIGQSIPLVIGSRRKEFRIRGLLLDEGPARALDGNFALMDIAAAQWAADRLGFVDYVDLRLKPDLQADTAEEQIRTRLPAGLVVEKPQANFERAETMIAAFQFNLAALSGIALLVGLFLIYNAIAISVAARRDEIGMLQAIGAGRGMVLALFLGEAALVAAFGAGLGLWLGKWLAAAAVQHTAQTVETFYIAETARASAAGLSLGGAEILMALTAAMTLSLLAAAVPALQAASIGPVEVISGASRLLANTRAPRRQLGIALLFFLAGWLATRQDPVANRPLFGFLAQFLFALGGAFLVPGLLWLVCKFVVPTLAGGRPCMVATKKNRPGTMSGTMYPWSWSAGLRTWPRRFRLACRLAAANLLGAVSRVSVSVAALTVSLSMMVAIAVMVGSFRETVVYWLDATLHADIFIRPAILRSSLMEARIDARAVAQIRRDPAVESTGYFASRQVPFGARTIRVAATDLATVLARRVVLFKSPADGVNAARRALGSDAVWVSESFALRFKQGPGDAVALPTPQGLRNFPIAAVYYDYANNQGTVLMNGDVYARTFGEQDPAVAPTSMSVILRPGADAETVRTRLEQTVGAEQDLYFATNDNVRREALRIFDNTFTITYALQLIAIAIAGLGVVSTLLTLLYERQREIALLALVGADRGQIRTMVLVEALLIAGISQLLGALLGIVLACVLIYVINVQSFAWTIQFHLPLAFLVQSTLLVLAAAVICGLYPASRAANIHAIRAVREE